MDLESRLEAINARIAAACARAGRSPDSVTVVAVAKKFGPDNVKEAADAGLKVIGENRVQEAAQKIPLSPSGLEWHLIGHLQRNKARTAARLFAMVHSVDSERILDALDAACGEEGKTMPICLEVNVSGESSKQGFAPGEVPGVLEHCAERMNVDVTGLMTMPPFTPDPEDSRTYFRALRDYRDAWRKESGFELAELSMGMSNDFEVAIEEGSTMIRVGTALFGSRPTPAGGGQ